MSNVSGSLRGVTIEGISFRVSGDTNATITFSEYENSVVPTSGKGMRVMKKRVPSAEGIILIADLSEVDQLRALVEGMSELKFTIKLVDGGELKAKGVVECENFENEEGRISTNLYPTGSWTFIPA